jgi:hypothetical protein
LADVKGCTAVLGVEASKVAQVFSATVVRQAAWALGAREPLTTRAKAKAVPMAGTAGEEGTKLRLWK